MNPSRLAVRRVGYLCLAAALLYPLVILGQPATTQNAGGKLAQLRASAGVGQAHFGEIDTAGESVRLASLGMQGFAAMALWAQAHEQQKKQDWWGYEETLGKIMKVSPHFVNVWKFQAHNMSYNMASMFNDYRHRYEWTKKGIALLKEGRKYNENDPRILYELGWFICHKIGQADDAPQFRRMFRDEEGRDNWLVGKEWYQAAQDVAQRLAEEGKTISLGMSRSVFHNASAMAQIQYALAIEREGLPWHELDDLSAAARRARIDQTLGTWEQAWRVAALDWWRGPRSIGARDFAAGQAFSVRINDFADLDRRLQALARQLYEMAPEIAEELLRTRRREVLFEDEAAALALPRDRRTPQQQMYVVLAVPRLALAHDVAELVAPTRRTEAIRLADEVRLADFKVTLTEQLMTPIRFDGWKMHIAAELEPEAIAARRDLSEAAYAHRRGQLLRAKGRYESAFRAWSELLKKHPAMMDEVATSDEMMEQIVEYRTLVVGDMDGEFPKDFVLQNVLDEHLAGSEYEHYFRPAGAGN